MNFTELYKKISLIEQGVPATITECPCMDGPTNIPQKQEDNVNMNISINGQGSGGIRDLMDILRNIDKADGSEPSHDVQALAIGEPQDGPEIEPIQISMQSPEEEMPPPEHEHEEEMPIEQEEMVDDGYENSVMGGSDPRTFAISSVVAMGDDLLSHGDNEKLKTNGGGNPSAVSESLLKHLNDLYTETKQKSYSK